MELICGVSRLVPCWAYGFYIPVATQAVEGVVSGNRRIYGSELRGDFIGIYNGDISVHI